MPFSSEHTVLSSAGRYLDDYLRSRGVEFAPIAQSFGFEIAKFQEDESRISLDVFSRILGVCALVLDDDCFGLGYSKFYKMGGMGPFGYGLASAPNFKYALKFLVKFISITVSVKYMFVSFEDDQNANIEWGYPLEFADMEQANDFFAGMIFKNLVNCCKFDSISYSFLLKRKLPNDPDLYSNLLNSKVDLNHKKNQIKINCDNFNIENSNSDPVMHRMMLKKCEEILLHINQNRSLVSLVRKDVLEAMPLGNSLIQSVARERGMSERTLQRRLSDAGHSFQEILDAARIELSMQMLRETDLSISSISERLGYSSTAAYSRAAVRWHGNTPSRLRAEFRKAPNATPDDH
jgi:AraC-like DNA-binding protein